MSAIILKLCYSQDYVPPTYNPEGQTNPTNDYLNDQNDPRYDNPYDPNRRFQNRNQNQFELNRNQYDVDQR